MPKTGLKTFVYSFSVSLFAIFAANGIYWHNRPSASSEIKIPSKNIMLFLKNGSANPSNLSAPVKKIALSVLPEIKRRQESAGFETAEEEIIMADNFEMPEIPLEIELPRFDAPVRTAENAAPKPHQTQPEEVRKPEKIVIPLQVPDAAGIEQPKAESLPKPAESGAIARDESPEPQNTITREPVRPIFADNGKPAGDAIKKRPGNSKPRSDKLLLAQADEPIPLLLLEKSGDMPAQNRRKVRIGSPDELNQVALADKSVPIHSMEKQIQAKAPDKSAPPPPAWESMADKSPAEGSPWLVAKADGALKNSRMADESYYRKEDAEIKKALNPGGQSSAGVKVAAETVKNLLIPIPEDILNDENLTPQLSYSPAGKSEATEKAGTEDSAANAPQPAATQTAQKTQPTADSQENEKNKLLSSLNSIFSADSKIKEEKKPAEKKSILSEVRQKFQKKKSSRVGKIMPTEMRLSFQPNRAEISGQTLRWIQAFAAKAAEDNNMAIEIRIDGTSAMDLQQKRLNLLHNILTNKGVEYSKINTVFTQREPNSFIIKTITRNNSNQKGSNGNLNKAANGYYQQW